MNTTSLPTSYSLEAEQAVLGGLLANNEKWEEVSEIVNEHNFYVSAHKVIFNTIQSLLFHNQPADLLTVSRVLTEKKQIETIGGYAYLAEMVKNLPSTSNIGAYAKIVQRDSYVRKLYTLGNTLRTEASQITSQEKLEALVNTTEQQLTELSINQLQPDTLVSVSDALKQVFQTMEQSSQHGNLITGMPFGIEQLDTHTSGAQPGDLIILSARPSMGKTALSLVFAYSTLNASEKNIVQYYSLEMPATQIMQRLLAMHTRVSLTKIRQSLLMDDEDWARFSIGANEINQAFDGRLLIDDSSYLSPQLLRSRVRRNTRKYGQPSLIIVDYLQLMSVPEFKEGRNRNLEIASISQSLKQLAKEMDCPVIALSQLNRNLEQRADKRPMPSDLRDSGSLEQDADVLLFIYRDDVYNEQSDLKGIAEIIIGKQRNGPRGTIFSRFRGEYSTFDTLSETEINQIKSR